MGLFVAATAHADTLQYDVLDGSTGQIELAADGETFSVVVDLWVRRQGNPPLQSLDWEASTPCSGIAVSYVRFLGTDSWAEARLETSQSYQDAGPASGLDSIDDAVPAYTRVTISGVSPAEATTCTVTLQTSNVVPSNSIGGGANSRRVVTLSFVESQPPPDPCADREAPTDAPDVAVTADAAATGWFNTATGAPSFTVSPAADAEYSLDDGETWLPYAGAVSVTTEGITNVIARNVLPADGDCPAIAGPASDPLELKVDLTAPTVTPADVVDTTWRNTDLSQEFQASDGVSGLADPDDASFTLEASEESTIVDGEVVPTVDAHTVYDVAGNATTRTVSAWIDKTPPTTAVTGVPIGTTIELGEDYPVYGCSSTDSLSGVEDEATATLDESGLNANGVGTVVVTCAGATDQAGNTADSASTTFRVVYPFDGFFRPIDMDGVNSVKAGQSVPTKFSLGGDHGLDVLASGYPNVAIVSPYVCSSGAAISTDLTGVLTDTAGKSTLTYDPVNDEYTYVWKTDRGLKGECAVLQVGLDDGSIYTAKFSFK